MRNSIFQFNLRNKLFFKLEVQITLENCHEILKKKFVPRDR